MIVGLMSLSHLAMIVKKETGVIYTNQTGGHACCHPEIEGALIPLSHGDYNYERDLDDYFTGSKWGGWCESEIDIETADWIDELIKNISNDYVIKVDRSKLKESWESWIHVTFTDDGDTFCGILTWKNSD